MENNDNQNIVRITANYISEAKEAKRDRMEKNKKNFDTFHLKQDYSHKRPGQSREFLAKQAMAVEQIVAFFQQGLVDLNDWFKVTPEPGVEKPLLTENETYLLLSRQLDKADFYTFVGDSIKEGLLASLMIAKVHGEFYKKPKFYTEMKLGMKGFKKVLKKAEFEKWGLKIDLLRSEDYFPDPNSGQGGKPRYECQVIWKDICDLRDMSEGKHAIYDPAEIEKIGKDIADDEDQKVKKARETGQNVASANYRSRVKITECWGDIIDPATGDILHKNVVWTVANDKFLIQKPTPNPFWHGESPYVVAPILRVQHSVWHKSLMDAPTALNIAMNELFNLVVDGGMMATHGIKQLRTDWLEDTTEVENGIFPGQTLRANSNCPPGMKVLERVDTSTMSSESLAVLNQINAEFMQSALTNDLRMGTMPSRAVKATEVVEASQTITSVFTGVAKSIEHSYIEKILHKSWMVCLQNMDDIDEEVIGDLITKERALQLAALSPEERFAASAMGCKFKAYGVSSVLSKVKDFRKLTSLLQTVFSSDLLAEQFLKKYDPGKFLDEIMKSLDINIDKIKLGEEQRALLAMQAQQPQQQPGQMGPNMQSQIPQASTGPLQQRPEDMVNQIHQANFPKQGGAK